MRNFLIAALILGGLAFFGIAAQAASATSLARAHQPAIERSLFQKAHGFSYVGIRRYCRRYANDYDPISHPRCFRRACARHSQGRRWHYVHCLRHT